MAHIPIEELGDWRISIHDVTGRKLDQLDIIAGSWPAALQRAAQFFVTSKAMTSWQPAIEVRVSFCGDAA